ncbi:Major facilitator superfamily (Mfs_1) transporter [Xenorhabdus poinarii G6]|uniref:Major facilitator superfamily (Mfs_1) transporter n=1 Tax=Xenorhabdus poinarii G6 TaxID=1354304 RepID=A0A068R1U7_9GAMM|nr:MFS transporter [Xenorhabdus poinarii]CDG20876.1 Major facilitator superfamily (Mfs_1) transporter [Xenorhabdus poinarii G6]
MEFKLKNNIYPVIPLSRYPVKIDVRNKQSMTSDFLKVRYSEALYTLSSRILISIVTLYFLSHDNIGLSSYFLFSYFVSRSSFGIFLAHKFEKKEKKKTLMGLIALFISISLSAILISSINITVFSYILIAIGVGFTDSFFISVVNAFIPSIVDHKMMAASFRLTFLIQASNNLFGIALGIAGYQFIGIINMMWVITGASFIVVIILFSLKNKGCYIYSGKDPVSDNIKKTIKIFMRYRFEPYWALASLLINMSLTPFSSLIIPYFVVNVDGGKPIIIGAIEGCAAAGAIFSSCYFQKKAELMIGKARSVILSFSILGGCFLLLSFVHHVVIWCILAFLMGTVIIMNNVCIEASRAIAIPEKNRVKVQSMHNACIVIGNPLGLLITPFLITHYGYPIALMDYSLIVILVAIFIRFIPLFNELLAKNPEDVVNLYEIKYGDL